MSNDITHRSAVAINQAVLSEEVTVTEVVERFLERIETHDREINAFVTVTADLARKQARKRDQAVRDGEATGPLHGVPIAVKDLVPVEGERLTYGSEIFSHNRADRTAVVVDRILDAGAVIIGKTNTPEFGHKGLTDNDLIGKTNNPFDTSKNAGGSSGGSAAAVSAALVPLALGTDGGGSIRIPAAFCNLFGFKPTFGRIPRISRPNGFGEHTPMLHHGPLTRTVEDAALFLEITAGEHPGDPFCHPSIDKSFLDVVRNPTNEFRVAYSPNLDVFPIEERVQQTVESWLDRIQTAIGSIDRVELQHGLSRSELRESWKRGREVNQATTAAQFAEDGIDFYTDDRIPESLRNQIEMGRGLSAVDLKQADVPRTVFFDAVQSVLETYDILLTPTLGITAVDCDIGPEAIDGTEIDPDTDWRPTFPFNLTGHPVASIPAGTADGLPVGVQVVGPRFGDRTVLEASAIFERHCPWHRSYPFRSSL